MEKIVIAKWKIKESEASRILKMLPELAEKTRSENGNISYTIYQSENDPHELMEPRKNKLNNYGIILGLI